MSASNIPQTLDNAEESQKKEKNLTAWQKIVYILTHISLEPMVLVYAICTSLDQLTTQNLNLEKACRVNYHFNTSVCDAMSLRDRTGYEVNQEEQVQQLVSTMAAYKAICYGCFPVVLMLFFGSWSDRHGRRKPVIMIPMCGEAMTSICLFICAYFYYQLPLEANTFSESIPYTITGAWFCTFLGIFSYVSGLSTEENITLRIGAVTTCMNIGLIIGNFLPGFLIKPLGYKGIYLLSMSMMFFAITYCYFMVKDKKIVQEKTECKKNFLADFFDVGTIKSTFNICFNEGPTNRKWKMIAIMFCSMMSMGPYYGEYTVIYLYTRLKFGWNEVDYSVYFTTTLVIQVLGSLAALVFFTKLLKVDDALVGVISVVSKILACITYALAPTGNVFYIGAFVEVFNGASHIALRSLMAKIVLPHELGQSNSIFGICEATMPLVFGPIYTFVYNHTMSFFPGAFLLLSACLYVVTMSLYLYLYRARKADEALSIEKANHDILLSEKKEFNTISA